MIRIFTFPWKFNGEVIGVCNFDRRIIDRFGPLFELLIVIEAGLCGILVNPFFKVINLALFEQFSLTIASGIRTTIPCSAVNVVEEFGEASRVVGGEVFNYF
jgi:hypothetical protein